MNANHKHNIFHRWLPAIPAIAALIALPTAVQGQAAATGKLRVVAAAQASESNGDKDAVNETIEVRIENGKLTVVRNGEEIPAAQLKHDGNGIIILDQNGNKLEGSNIRLQGGGSGLDYVISGAGAEAPLVYKMLNLDPANADKPAPKVMLGVHMTESGPALEYHLGLEHGKTTMIMGVFEGLPAHDAGIRQYDIITKVNGKAPADHAAIREALADKDAGDSVVFTIIHEGKTKDVTIKLQKYDAEAMDKAKLIGVATDGQFFKMFSGTDDDGKWLRGLAGTTNLKELQHLFVAPDADWRLHTELMKPQIEKHLKDHLEAAKPSTKERRGGVEDQLERLDQRMAELEEMLGKLIEHNQKNP